MKLKRLKIDKFRNIAPGTELHFRDSLNVILGKNGTGKTTLLNLIVQLLKWDYSSLRKEPVSLEYELATQDMDLTIKLRSELRAEIPPRQDKRSSTITIQESKYTIIADIEITPRKQHISGCKIHVKGPEIALAHVDLSDPVVLEPEVALLEQPEYFHSHLFQRLLMGKEKLPEQLVGLSQTFWSVLDSKVPETVSRLDECTGYLELLTTDQMGLIIGRIYTGDDYKPRFYGFFSHLGITSLLEDAMEEILSATPDADTIRLPVSRTDQGLLPRLVNLLDFSSLTIRLERLERQQERIRFSGPRFEFLLPDGTILNHQLLSYGQKRLLSFYYYLESNPHFVVADELVNGMHHEWIEACLEDLGDRQAFLTSQNPLLLDYLTFKSAEEVRSSFILCRGEKSDGRVRLYWENMRPEEAEEFFKAYQVGIQHVSSILRTGGLW
jgi:energy-coupling factor transporter ATP-binding protein EcfA2